MTTSAPKPPGRAVLRLAGVFTQLVCALCLLLGTIAFVLIQQSNLDGTALAIIWSVAAMIGLVVGGLMSRGGLIELIASAAVDLGFGIVLLVMDYDDLRALLRILPESDVETVADALVGAAGAMIAISVVCLAAIPQALRYTRWLNTPDDEPLASSTARGFPPPPISANKGSVWHMPAQPGEGPSRRRMYFALAGAAIGVGLGIGIIVSTGHKSSSSGGSSPAVDAAPVVAVADAAPAVDAAPVTASVDAAAVAIADAAVVDAAAPDGATKIAEGSGTRPPDRPATPTIDALLAAERGAIGKGDIAGLAALATDDAFAFGVDADEVAEGRAALAAQLGHDLDVGDGARVSSRFQHVGREGDAAWIAEELDIAPRGHGSRRYAVTALAAFADKRWAIVAWCWAVQVPDADADRAQTSGKKPSPKKLTDNVRGAKELGASVRGAFTSWRAFVDTRSTRNDGFNFGSAPNERSQGSKIRSMFEGMKASVALRDDALYGATVGDNVGFAAANVDLTLDIKHTFRVLAVAVKESGAWRIVQTHWSHGGPIR